MSERMSDAPRDDLIEHFQIESAGLRGRLVRFGPLLDRILARHDYPDAVSRLLAEAIALTAALATTLKFDGIFTLQCKGDGAVSMLVADYRPPGILRGYAAFDSARLPPESGGPLGLVQRLLGAGYLAFTVDQGEHTERYQGIVPLEGATLADCIGHYFRQSEQIGTGIRVAAARTDQGWRAGAILLQRLPSENPLAPVDETAEDAWRRALVLLGTVKDSELTDARLSPNDLLFRLFHEDGVRVWDPTAVTEACRCNQERVVTVLRSFSREEIEDMVVDGSVTATCEFCSSRYHFAAADLLG